MLQGITSLLRRTFAASHDEKPRQLAGCAAELASLSAGLLRSSTEVTRKSIEQQARIAELVSVEERIRNFAELNASSSQEIAVRTSTLVHDADSAIQMVTLTARDMQELAQTVSAGAELMKLFADRVAEVDSVVTIIGEIARETNLIALNAAIEAANAGKKGDGFNIIAQEIRLLAERTGKSTVDLGNRTELMCLAARDVEGALHKSEASVEQTIKQTRNVERSFQQLRDTASYIQNVSAEVSVGSGRQLELVHRVTLNLATIDTIAHSCIDDADDSAETSVAMAGCLHLLQNRLGVSASELGDGQRGLDLNVDGNLHDRIATYQPRVDSALEMLGARCAEAGEPHQALKTLIPTSHSVLHFGVFDAADSDPWLRVIQDATNCTASIFVVSEPTNELRHFFSVATNARQGNGQPVRGAVLSPKSIAARKLLAGQTHRGVSFILGRPILLACEPIFTLSGDVIGALYIAHAL